MDIAFEPFQFTHGLLSSFNTDGFPTSLYAWHHDELALPNGATYFGFVYEGMSTLVDTAGEFQLKAGMYFSAPAGALIYGNGRGIAISKPAYEGFFQVG